MTRRLFFIGWVGFLVLGIISAFLEIEFPNSSFLLGASLGLGIAWAISAQEQPK